MSYVRACRAAVFATVCVLFVAVTGLAGASGSQGWSVAKANAYLESSVRIVDPAAIAAAKEALRTNLQPAGAVGDPLWLQHARTGLGIRDASCVGVTSAASGYVAFSCALLLNDSIGSKTTAFGELKHLSNGDWHWTTAAYFRNAG
jgi:hypothetical protein